MIINVYLIELVCLICRESDILRRTVSYSINIIVSILPIEHLALPHECCCLSIGFHWLRFIWLHFLLSSGLKLYFFWVYGCILTFGSKSKSLRKREGGRRSIILSSLQEAVLLQAQCSIVYDIVMCFIYHWCPISRFMFLRHKSDI